MVKLFEVKLHLEIVMVESDSKFLRVGNCFHNEKQNFIIIEVLSKQEVFFGCFKLFA